MAGGEGDELRVARVGFTSASRVPATGLGDEVGVDRLSLVGVTEPPLAAAPAAAAAAAVDELGIIAETSFRH